MHSYLIVGRSAENLNKKIDELTEKLKLKKLPFIIKKIDDVKKLADITKLSFDEKTAIIADSFDDASEEAQNAFLKALEEPQKNLVYILTAKSIENILPTIISRCQIIETQNSKIEIQNRQECEKFIGGSIGVRFEITSKITDRQDAINWLEEIILVAHEIFLDDKTQSSCLEEGIKTLKNLKLNANVQLTLTNFVVNLDR